MATVMKLLRTLAIAAVSLVFTNRAKAADVDFNRDVRPILTDNCHACHGPDENKRKGDLRLDVRAEAVAAGSIVPGKPEMSELLNRILAKDPDSVMPPPHTGKKLTAKQIETLRKWIAEGAKFEEHWAFVNPVRPAVPRLDAAFELRNPIDHFIAARLKSEGLAFSPPADKITLIRRVTLDLTGLPPTPAEVDAFLADQAPDAYEKVVDRLLASPHYGERMAVDWLDAARFADTHGYHIDSGRNMIPFRDYVIRSFNENKPFDRFTVEQLAGDLLPNASIEQKVASGFNRNHMINFEGGAIPAEYQTAYIIDRVNTTSTVWMGLTMGCAQCHDHKYDPLSQRDFYRMYAFFNNVPENGLDGSKGNAVPVLRVPTAEQEQQLAQLKEAITKAEAKLAGPFLEVDAAQAEWEKSPGAMRTQWNVATPLNSTSKGGATLKVLEDKSILASGKNPAQETYSVSFMSDTKTVSAIRIEALADNSLPAKGPGRGSNGNFVMTGVKLTLGSGAKSRVVKLKAASADYSQQDGGYDVASLLTNGPGWAVFPEVGKTHTAIFEFEEPVEVGDAELTIELQFNAKFAGHQIGRMRLASTDSLTPHSSAAPEAIRSILAIETRKRSPKQKADLQAFYRSTIWPEGRAASAELAMLRAEAAAVEKAFPNTMVMSEMAKPRDTHILIRGAYDKKGDKVTAGTPGALPPLAKDAPADRLALARWLISKEHPLTARVIVNRDWQRYFGTGLVKTSEDFGTQGEYPSHLELLDWLACDFRESGWDVKRLQRLIVTSATYRQSSRVTPELLAQDPENRLLARQSRLRLQAEFIRDQALATSGLLNREIGGRSVSPYQPQGIWSELTFRLDNKNFTAQIYEQGHGADLYRRTMYTFWKRTAPPPSLVTLDAPDREVCTVRRPRTNTPLQALVLLNDPTYVEASRKLAERLMNEAGPTKESRVTRAFRLCTGREPSERERTILIKLYDSQLIRYQKDRGAAVKLLAVGESPRDEKCDVAELAAWTMVASTIFNLDETVTRN